MADELLAALAAHRFCVGMKAAYIQEMSACAQLESFPVGAMLGNEGTPADHFYALLEGRVAIESYQPGYKALVLQTLHGGEVVGWSWLFPPYEWVFDVRAMTLVRTIAFDASCLRKKCEAQPALGYELMKRFAQVMTLRLKATRLQLMETFTKRDEGVGHE